MSQTVSQSLKKWARDLESALAFIDSDPTFVAIKVREIKEQMLRKSRELQRDSM